MMNQHFCDHVFRTLDLDGNGSLDFKEYVMAMDLVHAKTPEEKLKWAFRMYLKEYFIPSKYLSSKLGMTWIRAGPSTRKR